MFKGLVTVLRDLLPKRLQVPAKYWYRSLWAGLEDEMSLLEFLIKTNDLVIDVGGNRGIYAYRFWQLGARVEVFEPNPKCVKIMSAWATGRSNINIHSVALSNSTGNAKLHIPVDASGIEHDASASLESVGFENSKDELVPLQTLDSFQFSHVKFIKIDVEGHECGVIEGGATTLKSSRPGLLIEIEQRHNTLPITEVFDKVTSFGYQGFFLDSNRLTPLENFDLYNDQPIEDFGVSNARYINNFLFLHKERMKNGEYNILMEMISKA